MQCKAFKSNKMTFSEFKVALSHIAALLGVDTDEVIATIFASQGPLANNITLPKYVKHHDDREGWTGTSPQHRPLHQGHCTYWDNGQSTVFLRNSESLRL